VWRRWRAWANAGSLAGLGVVLCALVGCSGQSSFLTGGPSVGQLKTSLSHLEYENEQLKKTTAKLQRENRSMEDRLVQEQTENGDLTARLDDARNLLRDRGLDAEIRVGSHRGGETLGGPATEGEGGERANVPTGTRSRKRRTPFAQISGGIEPASPNESKDPAEGAEASERPRARTKRSERRLDDDRDQHSFHKAQSSWMPIADSSDDSVIQIR
jgi:hypothetical protein